MSTILGSRGVTPQQIFTCIDCSDRITGAEVIGNQRQLYVAVANGRNSSFRCECCQDDHEERNCTCES